MFVTDYFSSVVNNVILFVNDVKIKQMIILQPQWCNNKTTTDWQ